MTLFLLLLWILSVTAHPVCHLCPTGIYPRYPNHVIHMLYLGRGTCKQFYYAGLRGKIRNHLCNTLQFYAYEPCGCDPFKERKRRMQKIKRN